MSLFMVHVNVILEQRFSDCKVSPSLRVERVGVKGDCRDKVKGTGACWWPNGKPVILSSLA